MLITKDGRRAVRKLSTEIRTSAATLHPAQAGFFLHAQRNEDRSRFLPVGLVGIAVPPASWPSTTVDLTYTDRRSLLGIVH